MKRSRIGALVVVVVAAGVAVGWRVWRVEPPDRVALRSFDAMKAGDLGSLRACYSESAWSELEKVTAIDGKAASVEDAIRVYMKRVRAVKVLSTTVETAGDQRQTALVKVVVGTDTGEEPETIHLVRAGGRWLID
ncbi:MAG: hypothetical protein FJ399_06220 [Verrucomicrobia bacterium]|nr:hypothetical protein [Verrucomicrobiota bacterium]